MLEYYSKTISLMAGVSPLHEIAIITENMSVSLERMVNNIQSQWLILALFPVTVLLSGFVAVVLMLRK